MKLRLLAVVTTCFLYGCGDDGSTGGSSSSESGGGGTGGAPGCTAGSHEDESGNCVSELAGWTEGPPLTQARDHHQSFVVATDAGAFLYAAGGVEDNDTLFDDVEVAPLAADGTVGAWSSATPLPEVTAGAGVAVVENVVIIAGGYRTVGGQPSLSRATDVSVVGADGTLGAWSKGPVLSLTRFHGAIGVHNSDIFFIGGLTGDNTVNTDRVERATIGANGSVSAWTEVTALPRPLSHHAVAVYGDAIFVTGGLEGDPNNASEYEVFDLVLRASIGEDGALGAWTEVGSMPHTLSTHASFAHNGYLYVVGGIADDLENTDAVLRAPIAEDGMVGSWEEQPPVPTVRAHAHQTPLFGSFVYATGGALNHVSSPKVFIGRFE